MNTLVPGTLYLVATPIGNLGDITLRALDILRAVPAIAAEDTRHTHKLLSHHGIPRPGLFFACHEHNERGAAARIIGLLKAGTAVALVTDAGLPGVSDPGYLVVREALAAGLPYEILPGASAAQTALLRAGLPMSSYTFLGFLPRKPGKQRAALTREARRPHTLVLFESPFRIGALLRLAASVLGERPAAVCYELTKAHERVDRGTLGELAARLGDKPAKGEITVVIAGLERKKRVKGEEE
jgi:16S rRNA (cytidine1402-2'-O)-methyltransferase